MAADVDLSRSAWRKSSASYDSDCVEVAAYAGLVMVRDTRDARNTTLAYPCRDWNKFLMRLQSNVSYGYIEGETCSESVLGVLSLNKRDRKSNRDCGAVSWWADGWPLPAVGLRGAFPVAWTTVRAPWAPRVYEAHDRLRCCRLSPSAWRERTSAGPGAGRYPSAWIRVSMSARACSPSTDASRRRSKRTR